MISGKFLRPGIVLVSIAVAFAIGRFSRISETSSPKRLPRVDSQAEKRRSAPIDSGPMNASVHGSENIALQTSSDWTELEGSNLFHAIYAGSPSGHSRKLTSKILGKVRLRFARKYPRSSDSREKETITRLGLLRGLDLHSTNDVALRKEVENFYVSLLANEQWAISRQAMKNLIRFLPQMPYSERAKILSSTNAKILADAALTDKELLEAITFAKN